jgi:four helix bundle protein
MSKQYLTLNKINSHKIAFNLSNEVWKIVIKWDNFSRITLGSQFVRSVDSISANIAEGFGRHGKKDKICFYRIARASNYESLDWLEKAKRRDLISQKEYKSVFEILKKLPKEINSLIKYTNNNLTI